MNLRVVLIPFKVHFVSAVRPSTEASHRTRERSRTNDLARGIYFSRSSMSPGSRVCDHAGVCKGERQSKRFGAKFLNKQPLVHRPSEHIRSERLCGNNPFAAADHAVDQQEESCT